MHTHVNQRQGQQPAAHAPKPFAWSTQPQELTEGCPSAQSPAPGCPPQGHSWATGRWRWRATTQPQFPSLYEAGLSPTTDCEGPPTLPSCHLRTKPESRLRLSSVFCRLLRPGQYCSPHALPGALAASVAGERREAWLLHGHRPRPPRLPHFGICLLDQMLWYISSIKSNVRHREHSEKQRGLEISRLCGHSVRR